MNRSQIGRIGLVKAIEYFTIQEYTISLPINDTQWYDLIIEKNGKIETVQCKATETDKGSIDLRNTGGTHGGVYGNVLENPLDILFCVDKDHNKYLIPMEELRKSGNKNTITLKTTPNSNRQGFETYKYLVK